MQYSEPRVTACQTFRDFVISRRDRKNPRGDFIRDVRADANFPNVENWQDLHGYLMDNGACERAMIEALWLWAAFERRRTA